MKIVDSHTHIERTHLAPFNRSGEGNLKLLEREMQSAGVSQAILITSPDGMPGNRCFCGAQVVGTRETIRLVGKSKKFSVVAGVDTLRRVSAQVRELDRLFRAKKIVGVKVYLGYQSLYANDRRLVPFYKLCLRYDAPVIFHTGDTYGSDARVKYSHPLPIDDVAVDFPKLKIVIAHMGNPWLVDTTELLYKNENVYADISGLIADRKSLKTPYTRMMRGRKYLLLQKNMYNQLLLYCPGCLLQHSAHNLQKFHLLFCSIHNFRFCHILLLSNNSLSRKKLQSRLLLYCPGCLLQCLFRKPKNFLLLFCSIAGFRFGRILLERN
jgi:hypothetical protein